MKYKLKKKLLNVAGGFMPIWIIFLFKELEANSFASPIIRLSAILQGFYSNSYLFYDINSSNKHEYLSNYKRLRTKKINGGYSYILDNKIVFEKLFKTQLSVPANLCHINKGIISSLCKDTSINNISELIDLIKNGSKYIIKPVNRGGGHGIYLLQEINNRLYLNGKNISFDELKEIFFKLDDYIFTEFVMQAGYANDIFESATNTIRILTIQDNKNGISPRLIAAVHRFGSHKSAPTDNWTQGGLSFKIDINNGKILEGARILSGKIKKIGSHPETKKIITGLTVPNWDTLCNSIIEVLHEYPMLKYVGWDVVITNNGFSVIEANNYSDINIFQVHGGLLKNIILRKFYEVQRVI